MITSSAVNTDSFNNDISSGYSITAEYLKAFNGKLELGLGLKYQFDRKTLAGEDNGSWNEGVKLSFIPVYGLAKISFNSLYFKGQAGYSFFDMSWSGESDVEYKGDVYYGLGFGKEFNDFMAVEAVYNVNKGKVRNTSSSDSNVSYSNISLSLQLSF
mgnify:CR=1 FL=1